MAGRSYFRTARSHTNSKFELKNQLKIIHAILKLKGFPTRMIKRMSNFKLRPTSKPDTWKRFLGTTTFDKIGRRHSFVTPESFQNPPSMNNFFSALCPLLAQNSNNLSLQSEKWGKSSNSIPYLLKLKFHLSNHFLNL